MDLCEYTKVVLRFGLMLRLLSYRIAQEKGARGLSLAGKHEAVKDALPIALDASVDQNWRARFMTMWETSPVGAACIPLSDIQAANNIAEILLKTAPVITIAAPDASTV